MSAHASAVCPTEPESARKLDPELERTNGLAKSWAKLTLEHGKMHPLEMMRLLKDGAILGGTDAPMSDAVLAFDQCFAVSPPKHQAVITVWYKSGGSSQQKADRLRISRAQIYSEWKHTLSYFRGYLRGRGLDI